MCVCFNHSNLVPTAEPSGDRKQKRVWDEGPRREERSDGEREMTGGKGSRNKRDERGG